MKKLFGALTLAMFLCVCGAAYAQDAAKQDTTKKEEMKDKKEKKKMKKKDKKEDKKEDKKDDKKPS